MAATQTPPPNADTDTKHMPHACMPSPDQATLLQTTRLTRETRMQKRPQAPALGSTDSSNQLVYNEIRFEGLATDAAFCLGHHDRTRLLPFPPFRRFPTQMTFVPSPLPCLAPTPPQR